MIKNQEPGTSVTYLAHHALDNTQIMSTICTSLQPYYYDCDVEGVTCRPTILMLTTALKLLLHVCVTRYWGGKAVMKRTWPYDMWSVGVVWLELLLATPHVFQITPRTAALLQRHLHLHHKSQVGCFTSATI